MPRYRLKDRNALHGTRHRTWAQHFAWLDEKVAEAQEAAVSEHPLTIHDLVADQDFNPRLPARQVNLRWRLPEGRVDRLDVERTQDNWETVERIPRWQVLMYSDYWRHRQTWERDGVRRDGHGYPGIALGEHQFRVRAVTGEEEGNVRVRVPVPFVTATPPPPGNRARSPSNSK